MLRGRTRAFHAVKPAQGLCCSWQVPLPGCYVGRIAVGMQHAAALAELLDQQSSASQVLHPTLLIEGYHVCCTPASLTRACC